MKTTTLADIIINARAVAQKAFAAKSIVEARTIEINGFKESGFADGDFQTWENCYNGEIALLENFTKQPSPATIEAKKAGGANVPASRGEPAAPTPTPASAKK